MPEDKQRTLGREHINSNTGLLGNKVSPDSGGINGYTSISLTGFAGMIVAENNAFYHSVLHNKFGNLMIIQHRCTMAACIYDIGCGEMERVYRRVGNPYSSCQSWIYRRLKTSCFFRVDDFCLYSCFLTVVNESLLIA